MNNLYQQLNQRNQTPPQINNNNLKQLISAFKNSNNPQQFIMNMTKNNQNFSSVLNSLQNGNESAKDLFYKLAKQKGVNPDDIINMIQQA